MPRLVIFAGPNGSGKSTVTSKFGVVGEYVNADEIKKALSSVVYALFFLALLFQRYNFRYSISIRIFHVFKFTS